MSRRTDVIQIIMIIAVTAVIMAAGSMTIYYSVTKPEFYTRFVEIGYKAIENGQYSKAVTEFNKAISLSEKSTQPRVGRAICEIALQDTEAAADTLHEAQSIEPGNRELLLDMLNIINDADPETAYELLKNYISYIGEDNIDDEIRAILDTAKEDPKLPEFVPRAGKYVKPFMLKLESDKIRIGHTLYYTDDGTEPSKESQRYKGAVSIDSDTVISVIACNADGKVSEPGKAEYVIVPQMLEDLENILQKAKDKLETTEVGTAVGNCVEGAKEPLQKVVDNGDYVLAGEIISYEDAKQAYDDLDAALKEFENKIIVETDKRDLEKKISEAQSLLENAVEGESAGQYRSGAKDELKKAVNEAEKVRDNILARQKGIDKACSTLADAIERFKRRKYTEEDIIFRDAGAKTGPVTVSLLWHSNDDLDLHVTSPKGDTIYYQNKVGSSGGMLDVDRQVDTFVQNPVENIYWSDPPRGTYTVKVNVFNKRSSGSVPIKVRVLVNGEARYYDLNISSGMNSVTTFTY